MVQLTIVTRDGAQHPISAEPGGSLMEAIRDAGFDELEAMCGGCLSCATCHVFIDADHRGHLTSLEGDEHALLEGSEYFEERSRLSCQIPVTEELNGALIEIAPQD